MGSIPGSGRFPRGGNGSLLQHSCWDNPMDRGACPWGCKESHMTEHASMKKHNNHLLSLSLCWQYFGRTWLNSSYRVSLIPEQFYDGYGLIHLNVWWRLEEASQTCLYNECQFQMLMTPPLKSVGVATYRHDNLFVGVQLPVGVCGGFVCFLPPIAQYSL